MEGMPNELMDLNSWISNTAEGLEAIKLTNFISVTAYTLCLKKNVLTLKRYSSELQGAILMKFGRNIQNTLE